MEGIELKRINENNNGELPKLTKILITVIDVKNPKEVLFKTKEIMKIVSQFAYSKDWPSDKEWKTILPNCFVESMTSKSLEYIMKTKGQWHFESWVANIKDRAWLWYSSKVENDRVEFVLETLSIPYLFSTFVYIIYSQGIPMKNIIIKDDVYDEI